MPLPFSSMLTGIFAIMLVVLTMQVSLRRRAIGISLGDGDDEILRRRIRAHGNFIESVPLALIVLGVLEISQAPGMLIAGFAGALLLARITHAVGIVYSRKARPRVIAMVVQNSAFIIAAGWLLWGQPA